jgi:uncharacterized membrane protein YebE (DUF533 family)
MKNCRNGTLPPDLKSITGTNRNEELKEALYTLAALVVIAALFVFIVYAASVSP